MGLISTTPLGAEILDDYAWEATLSPLGSPTGICVPIDVERFVSVSLKKVIHHHPKESDQLLQVPSWETISSVQDSYTRLKPPESQDELEAITAISNLANAVIANTASRSLAKLVREVLYWLFLTVLLIG